MSVKIALVKAAAKQRGKRKNVGARPGNQLVSATIRLTRHDIRQVEQLSNLQAFSQREIAEMIGCSIYQVSLVQRRYKG